MAQLVGWYPGWPAKLDDWHPARTLVVTIAIRNRRGLQDLDFL